ncbi:endothelial zinc finger protein induced by tumor necrosis factor alpha-like isoform X2 [Sparus aurata]|uniref:endothelial zinc finger protein induced by tumor necrosis factor alpha-like isoform X2 n=1 Tax=Sparus aurata TaxID=8175 RepID=UPI0011C1B717|nr:endothelial zinc finger protein induced by tumor necrosis factor alpha-like isoform X2 [Sparus aurata]XP_030255003.1 endothelial zinc finger protein induced by tumor necrosis factor alpha-like isoform X2 [Sparus aurata]
MNKDDTDGAKTGITRWTRSNKRLRQSSPSSSVFPSDVQQLVIKEEVSQEWCLSQEQTLFLEPLHMKEEQEEHWISQKGEQLYGLKETDKSKFPSTAVPVKSENDEEKTQRSQLHQSQTEDNREAEPPASSSTTQIKTETDGGSDSVRNQDPDRHAQLNTEEEGSDCSETDVSSGEWQDYGPETKESDSGSEETRAPQSGLNALKHVETPVSDVGCNAGERTMKGDKPFGCDACGKRYTALGSLRTHMRVHTGVKPFSCDVCRKRFIQQGHLISHMRVHAEEKPFGCAVCGKRFWEQQSLSIHMRVHTGERPFGCDVCGKRFSVKGHLKRHMRVHRGEGLDCSETVVSSGEWQDCGPETKESDSGSGDTRVPQSGLNVLKNVETPVSDVGRNAGKRVLKKGKPFICDVCGKRFTALGRLRGHMRVHIGVKPLSCDVCKKRFIQQGHLKRHMRVHTVAGPFDCVVCGKRCGERACLRRHMSVHGGYKPFACDVCGKRFILQGLLKRHMRVHTGVKSFACDVCGKKFILQGNLKRHMRVHRGESPFACDNCGKIFTRQYYLKRHMKVHTGEKPFGCGYCGKSFTRQACVKRHMRVHTGEKPFVCDVCGKRFTQKEHLKTHVRVHTGEKCL